MASSQLIKVDGNPEGKGINSLMADWRATEPLGVVAKPQRQVLGELFISLLVLSASFKYRPAPGSSNYLYWSDEKWSLSLIAPQEWSQQRRDGFAGRCVLQHDMTWTIVPSENLHEDSRVGAAIRRFFVAFSQMLNTNLMLEEILPFHADKLFYYQRLYACALSRSVCTALARGGQTAISCLDWRKQLSLSELPARIGFDPSPSD